MHSPQVTISPGILDRLHQRRLLPPPEPPAVPGDRRTAVGADRFRGAILGTAIGDALGRPAEGCRPDEIRDWGGIRDFLPWFGWEDGPVGTWTDDTQMTMCVAESLIARGGRLDPNDLATRFVDWLPAGRGVGATCRQAVTRLTEGVPWWEAGVASAGNGAAMRVAPVGLLHAGDLPALRHDAALSAVVTHADPMAVSSAIAQAFIVAWCAQTEPGRLDVAELVEALAVVLSDVPDPGAAERRPGAGDGPFRLVDRLGEVPGLLSADPGEAFAYLFNGAFVLESLPAALWCFLRSPEDAEQVLVTAVHGGYDADTVAAMAGAMVGAYLGDGAFPERWRGEDLEEVEGLTGLALALHALRHERSPVVADPGRREGLLPRHTSTVRWYRSA
jgi:ADP-ribosylglycohydrolase